MLLVDADSFGQQTNPDGWLNIGKNIFILVNAG